MKKPRFTEQEIAQALRQAEQGTPATEVCRKLGVSEATSYTWRSVTWACASSSCPGAAARGRKSSPQASGGADLTLDKQMLQEVLQKKGLRPARRRPSLSTDRLAQDVLKRDLSFNADVSHYRRRPPCKTACTLCTPRPCGWPHGGADGRVPWKSLASSRDDQRERLRDAY
jgi:transposase